jgi:hypothetical protein
MKNPYRRARRERGEEKLPYNICLPKPELILLLMLYSSSGITWKIASKSPQPPFIKGGLGGFFQLERDSRVINLS